MRRASKACGHSDSARELKRVAHWQFQACARAPPNPAAKGPWTSARAKHRAVQFVVSAMAEAPPAKKARPSEAADGGGAAAAEEDSDAEFKAKMEKTAVDAVYLWKGEQPPDHMLSLCRHRS